MNTIPVLTMPNFPQEFIVEVDALRSSLGAVLMQGGRPITFISHVLSPPAQAKLVYERELMAIVSAVYK